MSPRERVTVVGLAKKFEISRGSVWRAFLHGSDELRWREVRVHRNVMDYSCGTSKHHAMGRNQEIDMRPRKSCVWVSGFAKSAVVKSAEIVLPKNTLGFVEEPAKLFHKPFWCRSAIVRVVTLKPSYRAQGNTPTIGI